MSIGWSGKLSKTWGGSLGMWLALTACAGGDEARRDVETVEDVADVTDTEAVDEVDTIVSSRHQLAVTLDPPGIGNLSGWVVMNRFGRWTTDSSGQAAIEVARTGLTLSLVLPQGVAGDDARVPAALVIPTIYLEDEVPPARANIGVRDGAVGLILLDPRMATEDMYLLKAAAVEAYASTKVAALAAVIDTRFDARGVRVLLTEPEVLSALDKAVEQVGVAVGTAWAGPGRLPTDVHEGEGDRAIAVGRLGARTRALVELVEGAAPTVARLPLVPGALTVKMRELDLEQGALTRPEALADPTVATVFKSNEVTLADLTLPSRVGVFELVAQLDDGPRGESSLAQQMAARTFPGAGCATRPEGFLAAIAAELDCREADAFEVAAGTRLTRVLETVASRALAQRAERQTLGLDPTSAWAPFAEPLTERLRVAIGEPFLPQPVARGETVVGGRVTLEGHLVARPETRVVLRDAAGRRQAMERIEPPFSFLVPEGVAGQLVAEVYGSGGVVEVALGTPPIEIETVWPPLLDRVRSVRLRGRGFHEGGSVVIGGQTVTLPATAEDEVYVELDPSLVGVGIHTVGGATLRVPDAISAPNPPSYGIRGAMTSVGLAGVWVDSPLSVRVSGQPMAILSQTRSETPGTDVDVLVDTSELANGQYELRFESSGRVFFQAIVLEGGSPIFERRIEFFASTLAPASAMLRQAVEMANGTRPIEGTFRRLSVGTCPLDIEPDEFSYPAPNCPGPGSCDEGWYYDDQRDPTQWWRITRPPGRGSTGVRCPVIPGPDTWAGLPVRDVFDTVTSTSPAELTGVTLVGPRVRLTLPEARGGGLTVAGSGGTSEVVLDLVVKDAVGSVATPVVTISGARGVRVERLEVTGRPGQCKVALRIINSVDIDVRGVAVSGCETAIEVIDSARVRIGRDDAPAIALGSFESFVVRGARDVLLHMRAGTRPDGDGVARVMTGRGAWIEDSARVVVTGSGASLVSEAVLVHDSNGVRIQRFESGVSRTSAGEAVVSAMNNTRGIRIEGTSRDVVIRETTAVAAGFGVDIADSAEVRLERVAIGGVYDGLGAGSLPVQPLGNHSGGLRIFGGEVEVEGMTASRNGLFGIGVFGGRVRLLGLTTTSRAGEWIFTGAQTCAIQVGGGRVTLVDANIDGDVTGVCARDGVVRIEGGVLTTDEAGVAAEQSRIEVIGAEVSGRIALQASTAALTDVDLRADDIALSVNGSATVRGGTIDGDEAVVVSSGSTHFDEVVVSGRVGLSVQGADPNGVPGVVMARSIIAAEDDILLVDEGLVVLRDTAWRTLTSVDRSVVATDTDVSERTIALSGAAKLQAHLAGHTRIEARDHVGTIWLRGGAVTLDSEGLNFIHIENQDIREATLAGAHASVSNSTLSGELRCDACSVALSRLGGAGRVTLLGGIGHMATDVRVTGGVTLSRWAEAVMTGTDPVNVGAAMPLARLSRVESSSGDDTVWVDGVPDRARVALARRNADGLEVVGWAQAIGGRARWVGADGLVAAVTAHGTTGAWQRAGRPASCTASIWPISESALVSELRWETDGGWSDGGQTEVATCGDKVARVIDGGTRKLEVDGVEVATAAELSDIAFDARCEHVVWVGVDGAHDIFVTALATGVTTRVTDDTRIETRPRFGPDGAIWFAHAGGSTLSVARDGVTEVALALDLEVSAPAPAPDGRGVAFIACGASCRLAWWEPGAWSYFDTAALGDDGPCEAAEPRWLARPGEPALLAYVREGQLVLATASGVVLGALADDVLKVR